jgi:membrane associated rhomboid family serine protease
MFRSRGENLRAVYILLFLNVAFFLLENQDPAKYAALFSFDWPAIQAGEVWRLFTYQFTHAGSGMVRALSLFITLLLLYMMGAALEEEWGTRHFLTIFFLSTLGSAAIGAWLGIVLMGTYFVYFTLLFIYAAAFPQQTFYLFMMIPVRVRVLAFFALAVLVYGVVSGGATNLAALAGAAAAYVYYLSQRVRIAPIAAAVRSAPAKVVEDAPRMKVDVVAVQNGSRYAAIRQALAGGNEPELDRIAKQCESEIVAGVNICPPADYKPDNADGYCIRCEGFAECSVRYIGMHRASRPSAAPLAMPGEAVKL